MYAYPYENYEVYFQIVLYIKLLIIALEYIFNGKVSVRGKLFKINK